MSLGPADGISPNGRQKGLPKSRIGYRFWPRRKPAKMFRADLYARVSTNDQQTLPMQNRALREYAARRAWTIELQVREVNPGAAKQKRAKDFWWQPATGKSM